MKIGLKTNKILRGFCDISLLPATYLLPANMGPPTILSLPLISEEQTKLTNLKRDLML
jgi:hypothetical protein